jgi:hypothetical protein
MDLFNASVPGQSLTKEVGQAPYERPPQFADVEDALEYVFDKLSSKRGATKLVLLLKRKIPAEYIARTIIYGGFTSNKWTPDVGLLMGRLVLAMVIAIGTQAGVKNMVIFNPDKEQEKFFNDILEMPEGMDESFSQEPEEEELSPFSGLMGVSL